MKVIERPAALFAEYELAKAERAISSLDEFPLDHRWMLDEVTATLTRLFGEAMQYWLVSSWVDGGWVTPDCDPEWIELKNRKRTWDGIFPHKESGHKKWSDFDVTVRTPNGNPVAVLVNGEVFGWKQTFATESGLLIDIYPEKEVEMENALLLNPSYVEVLERQSSFADRVPRFE